MKSLIFVLSFVLFFLNGLSVSATEGCLVGNTFYTSYLGLVRLSNNPEIIGDKKVFNSGGTQYPINYSGAEVCLTVTVNKYSNGSPDRSGPLCFVMAAGTYNGLPASGTPGVRVANYYPNPNGSLQDFTISCLVTPLPLDDYIPFLIGSVGLFGFILIRKQSLQLN